MKSSLVLLGMGLGAALMYVLDPQQGNRRRALARDRMTKAMHTTGHAMGATSRDLAHRATGLAASLHSRFFDEEAPDEVIAARVRARLGRVSSHPGAIEVDVRDGVITLIGPVLRNELQKIVRGVSSVRGVKRVENHLDARETAEGVPELQGRTASGVRSEGGVWSATTRLAAGIAGAVLVTIGLARRDKLGMLFGGGGVALMARAVVDTSFEKVSSLLGRLEGHEARGVRIPVRIRPTPELPFRRPPQAGSPGQVH